MHTAFALRCFVVVIHWLIFPYPSGLLHWHCGNLTMWIDYERLHNHNKAKHNKTVCIFLGIYCTWWPCTLYPRRHRSSNKMTTSNYDIFFAKYCNTSKCNKTIIIRFTSMYLPAATPVSINNKTTLDHRVSIFDGTVWDKTLCALITHVKSRWGVQWSLLHGNIFCFSYHCSLFPKKRSEALFYSARVSTTVCIR